MKFSRIEASSELSNSKVNCVLQDSKGFLWVGTEDGLNRFDGYDFKIYRNHPDDTTSLLKNGISNIYEDSQGALWVSTLNGGLHTYNNSQDNFTRIAAYSFDCDIPQILEDRNKNIWVVGVKSKQAFVSRLNRANNHWEHFDLFPSTNPIAFLWQASEDEFWMGANNTGFFKWNMRNNSLERYFHDEKNPNSIVSNLFHKAIHDARGNIWIATAEGLSKFDPRKKIFTNFTTKSTDNKTSFLVNNILNLCEDGDDLWIGTENGGLSRLDTKDGEFTNFLFNKNDPTSVVDNSIWSIYKDRQGRIWVGTYSKGLCVIDRLKEKFSELDVPLENDVVNAIWQDSKNRFWIGTEGGMAVRDGRQLRYYKHTSQKNSLGGDPVLSIFEDSRHQLWAGTWGGGLSRYVEEHDYFMNYLPDEKNPNSLSNPNVFSINEQTQTGHLLVGTYQGLNILTDEKTGQFERHTQNEFEFNNFIRTVYEDRKGNVWIGTIEELTEYQANDKKIVRFNTGRNMDSIKVGGLVNCILEDRKGKIWVGTSNGLHLLVAKKFVKRYTVGNGLPNNIVNGILEDDWGNLWLSTTQGISKFNPVDETFKNFDVNDGLLSKEFRPNACFRSKEGQLFFGGKGVNFFYPDSIKDNPHVPPVFITDLKLFNQSVKVGGEDGILKQQISEVREISLPPQYIFFAIDYVALNFTATRKNQYAYMLEGFDEDWNYVGNHRSVTFTNLDVGTYTFRVKACNNDGLWNESGTTLVIHILPPLWKTWWFRTMAVLFVVGMARGYYKMRVKAIERQNRKLEGLVAKRTEELQNTNEELVSREEEIQKQNNDLSVQQEELASQNGELQKARQIIEKQNDEIKLRNETLEEEVKERTKDLVEYNQQLEQFAFISAHNLRAPVARILGLGNVLEMVKPDPAEQNDIVGKLVFATRELDTVVKDLITILVLRKDNTSTLTNISLEEEMRLVRVNLEKEIHETGAVIQEDFSGAPFIHTVKPYLDSILINLVGNAIRYRYPHRCPVVRIKSEVVEKHICLTVRDNGLGIDLGLHKEKIFTLYSRFHNHVEGKGMGLYLVKNQVVSLGGRVEVESEIDKGTTFRIFFKR
ncbi:two-component regulator propeller domain-containing protein [Chryseolinea lacunae]|uniref:two-component regulator propeller domain-containing protein n=1 Tax=Chryseolinea lacunae TaxID=2801331 RepID=UPI0034E1A171